MGASASLAGSPETRTRKLKAEDLLDRVAKASTGDEVFENVDEANERIKELQTLLNECKDTYNTMTTKVADEESLRLVDEFRATKKSMNILQELADLSPEEPVENVAHVYIRHFGEFWHRRSYCTGGGRALLIGGILKLSLSPPTLFSLPNSLFSQMFQSVCSYATKAHLL